MKFLAFAIAIVHGLLATFALFAIELIVSAFADGFSWPFSVWWGMVAMLPGLAIAVIAAMNDL